MAHRLSPEAISDLESIWYFVAREAGSVEIADRLIDAISDRFILLANFPRLGRARDDFRAELRGFPVGEYVIFYRIEDGDVLILRVIHGRRDLAALFDR